MHLLNVQKKYIYIKNIPYKGLSILNRHIPLNSDSTEKLKTMAHYSVPEEIAHSVSHGLAALLSVAACIFLTSTAVRNQKGTISVFAVTFFGISFIFLYLISFLYHTVQNENAKKTLRIFDHCMIYVLIAASYAPACLCLIRGFWGYSVFAVNFLCMIFGIVINIIDLQKYYKLSQALYIIMGWLILVAIYPMFKAVPLKGFILLAAGGVLYTVGVIFYRMKSVKYMHFIFHLFVIAGCIPHFIFVYRYCCL